MKKIIYERHGHIYDHIRTDNVDLWLELLGRDAHIVLIREVASGGEITDYGESSERRPREVTEHTSSDSLKRPSRRIDNRGHGGKVQSVSANPGADGQDRKRASSGEHDD